MNTVTLGVHLIVKNEAELLPLCLTSIAGADDIVVIDTGSTDESIAIAETYGARVFQHEWTDDFSAARNAGLAYAETDWILVLDADECLQGSLAELRDLLMNTEAQAFTVKIVSWLGANPEDRVKHTAVRLFRNRQGYQYNGRIHEGIDASLLQKHSSSAIVHSEMEIIHFGYLPEIMAQKHKIKRNEKLLELTIAEHPEDSFHLYNLAVTYCQDGRLHEAQQLFRRTLHQVPLEASYRPSIIRDLCKIHVAQGNMKSADALLTLEIKRYEDYPDLHFLLGQSLESQGFWERAFHAYHCAASIPEDQVSHKYVCEQGISTFRSLYRMGLISQRLGHQEDAARFFHRALELHSLYTPALQGIASAFQRLDVSDDEIAALLLQLLPPTTLTARAAVLNTLYEINAYETITVLSRDAFPLEPDTAICILSSLLITGRTEEANNLITQMMPLASNNSYTMEFQKQLFILRIITSWELTGELNNDLLSYAPEEYRVGLDPLEPSFLLDLIHTSGKLHKTELGEALVSRFPSFRYELAAALYKEGYWNEAGEHFITLVHDQLADERTLFFISELIYDQELYSEASEWFRRVLELNPAHEPAKMGLSLCYLHQARLDMEKALRKLDDTHTQGPLQEDIGAIHKSITLLQRTPWHSEWSFRQAERRNPK